MEMFVQRTRVLQISLLAIFSAFLVELIFGLISGNSNIVKIPSKKYEEIELICESINKVLKNKNFSIIRNMIAIVRYNKFDLWTKNFSMICDARLIWGGDKTIHEVKQYWRIIYFWQTINDWI